MMSKATKDCFLRLLNQEYQRYMDEINALSIGEMVDRAPWLTGVQKSVALVESYDWREDEIMALSAYSRPYAMVANEIAKMFSVPYLRADVRDALSFLSDENGKEVGKLLTPQARAVFLSKLENDHDYLRQGWIRCGKYVLRGMADPAATHEGIYLTLKEFAYSHAFTEGELRRALSDDSIIGRIAERVGLSDDIIWEDIISSIISDIMEKDKKSIRGSRGDER